MSRKPSFANLRDRAQSSPDPSPILPDRATISGPRTAAEEGRKFQSRPSSREGRKQIAGFFTPRMSLAMHMLARRQDRSLQALMTEAFNDVLRKYGESPLGE